MSVAPDELHEVARKRLEEQRGFVPHLIAYIVVNTGLIVLWAVSSRPGFFWPGVVLGAWGLGLVMHAWSAFFSKPITDADVQREIERLRKGSGDTHPA